MEARILDAILVQIPWADLLKRLHVEEGDPLLDELKVLVRQAEAIGRPRALCGLAYIDERGDDFVVVDGVRFTSRVLAVNLEQTHRVFPFVATCGGELEDWAEALDDPLHRYWSEAIREMALGGAFRAVADYLEGEYRPGQMSRMNPGSLADWPLQEQVPLFRLLGDPEAAIGVRLTESLLMLPRKSVSGIRFSTTTAFESCMLCPRPVCRNRRADYDPALYSARYAGDRA